MGKKYSFLIILLPALLLLSISSASGAVFTVTKTADSNDGICDSDCSLREAVTQSNAAYSNDIIIFSPSLIGGTVTVAASPIEIAGKGDLTIEGPGSGLLTIFGGNETPIFVIRNPRIGNPMNIRFAGMKMTGGKAWFNPGGAAISSPFGANVEIDRVFFTGNSTELNGTSGGAVYLKNGVHRISSSTFTNNSASTGGAVLCTGNVTIVNSTFSTNNANIGGALDVFGYLKMRNVTIYGNTASFGASMRINSNTTVNTGNTVVAGGFASILWNIQLSGSATITSAGNNIIYNTEPLDGVVWQNSDLLTGNLHLIAPADNGGGMPTYLPQAGSILIDTGGNALADEEGLAIDQRGYYRIVGGNIDRGAVETGSSPAVVMIAGRILSLGRPVPHARVTLTDMSGTVRKYTADQGGYYFFIVPAGASYFAHAVAAPYTFSPRLVNANRELTGIDLAAE